jgi:WD40 repeat protein
VNNAPIIALAYSPDGQMIATGINLDIRIWRIDRGILASTVKGSADTILEIHFTPDSQNMVTLAGDGSIRIWGVP